MAWIETRPASEATGELKAAYDAQRALYPPEYAIPTTPDGESIVASHSLIPAALHHAFAAYGVLLGPDLPLERRHHEMIATVVSVTNRCRY